MVEIALLETSLSNKKVKFETVRKINHNYDLRFCHCDPVTHSRTLSSCG